MPAEAAGSEERQSAPWTSSVPSAANRASRREQRNVPPALGSPRLVLDQPGDAAVSPSGPDRAVGGDTDDMEAGTFDGFPEFPFALGEIRAAGPHCHEVSPLAHQPRHYCRPESGGAVAPIGAPRRTGVIGQGEITAGVSLPVIVAADDDSVSVGPKNSPKTPCDGEPCCSGVLDTFQERPRSAEWKTLATLPPVPIQMLLPVA